MSGIDTTISPSFGGSDSPFSVTLEAIAGAPAGASRIAGYSVNNDIIWAAITGGYISGSGGLHVKDVDTVVMFSDQIEASLPLPPVGNVTLTNLGTYFDNQANPISISFTYSAGSGIIRASKACIGAVRVRYTATAITADVVHSKVGGVFEDASVLAVSPTSGVATTTASLSSTSSLVEHPASKLLMKVDMPPTWVPTALNHPVVKAVVSVAGTSPTVEVSSGSMSLLKSGQQQVKEVVIFEKTPYGTLSAVPSGGVSEDLSQFEDEFGFPVILFGIAQPNSTVLEGAWTGRGTYNTVGNVVLSDNEIALNSGGAVVLPVSGVATLTYTTEVSYYLITMDTTNEGLGHTSYVTAKSDGKFGAVTLTAPSN